MTITAPQGLTLNLADPANKESHYQVRSDGKLYIGQKECIVRNKGVIVSNRAELERLARIFTETLAIQDIHKDELWKVKPDGVTIHSTDAKSTYKGQVAFINEAAQKVFTKAIKEYIGISSDDTDTTPTPPTKSKTPPPTKPPSPAVTVADRIKEMMKKRRPPKTGAEARKLLAEIHGKAINWEKHDEVKKELGQVLQEVAKDDEALRILKEILEKAGLRTGKKNPLEVCRSESK